MLAGVATGALAGTLAYLAVYRPFVWVALRRPKSTVAIGLLALLSASLGSFAGAVVAVVVASVTKETAGVAWALVPLWAAWTRAAFPVKRWLIVAAIGLLIGTGDAGADRAASEASRMRANTPRGPRTIWPVVTSYRISRSPTAMSAREPRAR